MFAPSGFRIYRPTTHLNGNIYCRLDLAWNRVPRSGSRRQTNKRHWRMHARVSCLARADNKSHHCVGAPNGKMALKRGVVDTIHQRYPNHQYCDCFGQQHSNPHRRRQHPQRGVCSERPSQGKNEILMIPRMNRMKMISAIR